MKQMITDDTISNTFDLIAAVWRQALKDAKSGDREAIRFLDACCPDWRQLSNRYERRTQSKQDNKLFF